MGVQLLGADSIAAGFTAMGDTREITSAAGVAGRTVAQAAGEFAPGSLGGTVEFTEDDRGADIGSNSPYARWFHVPYLSQGNVTYAKKVSKRGRSYGQRIPDNPWLIDAIQSVEDDVVTAYSDAVSDLIDRSFNG